MQVVVLSGTVQAALLALVLSSIMHGAQELVGRLQWDPGAPPCNTALLQRGIYCIISNFRTNTFV
jgi:hypothetical protein